MDNIHQPPPFSFYKIRACFSFYSNTHFGKFMAAQIYGISSHINSKLSFRHILLADSHVLLLYSYILYLYAKPMSL